MARWEPDPRGRLLRAALDLFGEQGFEATTTVQLAERAGLTKATVFRLFADKREILFQGQAASVRTATEAVRTAPDGASALDAVRAALRQLSDEHVPEQQEIGRRIDRLIAASPELTERAAAKRAAIAAALQDALIARGEQVGLAGMIADIGVRAYYDAFATWTTAGDGAELTPLVLGRLDELLAALRPALA